MKRVCKTKDESLLMLVHGQLSPWQAFVLKSHASRCPSCRARLRRYGALSGALATVLASPGGSRPLPPLLKLATPKGMLIGIIVVGTLLSIWFLNGIAEANASGGSSAPSGGSCGSSFAPTPKSMLQKT